MACFRYARCRLCSEDIAFTCGNPVELGFHMIDRHSNSVVQYSIYDECLRPPEQVRSCPKSCCTTPARELPIEKLWQDIKRYSRKKCRRRRMGLYKTTLETWTTGGCNMICPNCSKEVKPLVHSQKNKVAHTSLGATFLLSCWPFCFMFPLQHRCNVDLFCPVCKQKLGVFDTTTGVYHTNEGVIISKPEKVPNIKRKNKK